MRNLFYIILLLFASVILIEAQDSLNIPQNSILKNFRPFPTPRTNYRPGTVYRIDNNNRHYFVEDVRAIKDYPSKEGTLLGRMTFTKDELLTVLNIEISADYASIEVEIKESLREFNEQTNIDRVMWENDKAENIIVDEKSKYYIIRETVSAAEVIYRFSGNLYNSIITGKAGLKKEIPRGDEKLDFPYSLTKRFEEPRRIFYLDQPVGQEPYGE